MKRPENLTTTDQSSDDKTLSAKTQFVTAPIRVPIKAVKMSTDGPTTTASISGFAILTAIPYAYRMKKAVRNFFLFFGLALIGALVPMLHIPLLLLFLGLSLFMAINAYVDDVEISGVDVICSTCNKPVILAKKRSDNYPFWVKCEPCQSEYRIEKLKPN